MRGIRIIPPSAGEHAEAMIRLRSAVFVETFLAAGCNAKHVLAHVSGWTVPGNICNYTKTVEGWLADRHSFVRVVVQSANYEDYVIGLMTGRLAASNRQRNYISTVQLHPDFRRHGIGTQLVNRFLASATSGCATELDVLGDNSAARAFYAAQGFRQISLRQLKIGTDASGISVMNALRLRRPA